MSAHHYCLLGSEGYGKNLRLGTCYPQIVGKGGGNEVFGRPTNGRVYAVILFVVDNGDKVIAEVGENLVAHNTIVGRRGSRADRGNIGDTALGYVVEFNILHVCPVIDNVFKSTAAQPVVHYRQMFAFQPVDCNQHYQLGFIDALCLSK